MFKLLLKNYPYFLIRIILKNVLLIKYVLININKVLKINISLFIIFCLIFQFSIYPQDTEPEKESKKEESTKKEKAKKVDPWGEVGPPIVVTGTKTPKLLKNSPVTTTVIRRKQIEAKGGTTLFQALKGTAGVVPEVNCQNCNFTGIRLNGLDSKYNQILFNGVQIVGSLAQVYIYQQVPETIIDKVEIVKGGGSTLYGGGAVGGVINVMTRFPKKNYAEVSTQQSWLGGKTPRNYTSVAASRVSENKKMGIYAFGSQLYSKPYFHDEDEFSEMNSFKLLSAGFSGFIKPIEKGELTYTVLNTKEKRRGASNFDKEYFQAGLSEAVETDNYMGILKWNQEITDKISYSLYASASRVEREAYYGANIAYHTVLPGTNQINPNYFRYANWRDYNNWRTNGTNGPVVNAEGEVNFEGDANGEFTGNDGADAFTRTTSNVVFGGTDFHYKINDNHSVLLGYQQSVEDLNDLRAASTNTYIENLGNFYTGAIDFATDLNYDLYLSLTTEGATKVRYVNPAVLFQYEGKFGKMFDLVAGIRRDKHSTMKNAIYSPRLALVTHLTENLDWRNSYSTGFRPPQVFVEDFHLAVIAGEATRIQNDLYLSSETSRSYSSSFTYEYKIGKAKVEHLADGYYTRLYDAFLEQPVEGNIFLRKNSSGAEIFGGEFETKVDYKQFSLSLSFTRQHSLYIDPRKVLDENDLASYSTHGLNNINETTINVDVAGTTIPVPVPDEIVANNPFLFEGGTYSREFQKVPSYFGNLLLMYTINNLSLSTDFTYWGKMYVPHFAGYIPYDKWEKVGYMGDLSFRIGYRFFRDRDSYVEAFAGVKNVFNNYQQDWDKGILRDVAYMYGPALPTTYYAGIKARF